MFLLNLFLKVPLFSQWYADYKQFTAFSLLKQPTNIKKLKTKIISIEIIAAFIFDILSFSLKAAESFAAKEMMFLAILMLILYFSERVISETYNTYDSFLNDAFEQEYSKESTSIIMELCSKVRNKVFQSSNDNKQTIVEHAELLRKTKTYLESVWKFHWKIPITISSTLTLVIMIVTMVIIEVRNNSGIQTIVILVLLLGCTIFYFVTSKKRIKITKQFRKKRRDAYSKEDVLIAEINHIEFISKEDFKFHANRFRSQLIETRELTKNERLIMNKAFIQRSVIASTFLILILLIKSLSCESFNMGVILNVVATSTVYSTILQKIGKIMGYFESIADIKIEVSTLYPEFKNIYDVYLEEESKVFSNSHVSSIIVEPFYATQDPKKTFVLHNKTSFTINAGDCVIVEGPTGCGKSTLLRLLTGQLRMPNNPIVFSNGEHGYLRAIEYQTDNALANNFVIQEITLEEKPENIDRKKLFEILRGLCLYDILLIKANLDTDLNLQNYSDEDKIFALLNMQKLNQFSSGQKQRFALAKLLYTMTTEHQVIALDEAFNRLNDFIAKTCAEFIVDYVHRDGVPRILLFATHQVEIISPLCNKHIAFEEFLGGSNLIVK